MLRKISNLTRIHKSVYVAGDGIYPNLHDLLKLDLRVDCPLPVHFAKPSLGPLGLAYVKEHFIL